MFFRRTTLSRIQALDPERDAQEIIRLVFLQEFPWDGTRALEFALFRTYAVPSIGAILDATGEFARRGQKRYDDTDLLINTFVEHGYDSDFGLRAIRRMNQIHAQFKIANEDYLYVLSTFVLEPIRWIERYGRRALCEVERQACYVFWREVAARMALQNVPQTLEALEAYNVEFEREHFTYTEPSRRVAEATRGLLLGWFLPTWLHGLGRPWVHALLDDPLLKAFGFKRASWPVRVLAKLALRVRGQLTRLLPERRTPRATPNRGVRTYPGGYAVEDLGPEPPMDLDPAFLKPQATSKQG